MTRDEYDDATSDNYCEYCIYCHAAYAGPGNDALNGSISYWPYCSLDCSLRAERESIEHETYLTEPRR